jgi:C1A family cysteine protease
LFEQFCSQLNFSSKIFIQICLYKCSPVILSVFINNLFFLLIFNLLFMRQMFKLMAIAAIVSVLFYSCQQSEVAQLPEQPERTLGCKLLPQDVYEAIPLAKDLSLPKAAPTVLTLNCPPVSNQGGEGSCVAWGTTYAARSIAWVAAHPGSYSTSTNIFSPEYVYNQIKVSDCAGGSYVTDGLNLLKNQGACTWATMPYSDANGCSTMPTTAQKTAAANYKTAGYSRVSITSTAIKAQLVAGKPVVVGGPVNNAFAYLTSGKVLGKFSGSSLGGHCYCVVGYDDSKSAFKFINSWGTNWGTAGYGYISYSYVSKWFQEAYVLN